MVIERQKNGDLVMRCEDVHERRRLLEHYAAWILHDEDVEEQFVEEWLGPKGYERVQAEEVGALTSAMLIMRSGTGGPGAGAEVWGDMDYQVQSCVQELILGEAVRWTKG